MPEEFKAGRLIAFKLMCNMFVRRHDHLPSFQLLNHFYRLMHVGLTTIDKARKMNGEAKYPFIFRVGFLGRYSVAESTNIFPSSSRRFHSYSRLHKGGRSSLEFDGAAQRSRDTAHRLRGSILFSSRLASRL